jgi:hexosaminidase
MQIGNGVINLHNVVLSYEQISPALAFGLYEQIKSRFDNKDLNLRIDISCREQSQAENQSPCCQMGLHLSINRRIRIAREGYRLRVDKHGIRLLAKDTAGLHHAVQTYLQLMIWAVVSNQGKIPLLKIEDTPQYPYRGMHLDVSRHFFPVEFIKQFLDEMANLKLNKFHWHLTDDQGWRIESKKFPLLTETGAWRKEADGSRYGGFYTQPELIEVVRYAAGLGIEVIPEIDIPGHSQAILAAYPLFACFPQDFETLNVWGISDDILCAGKDAVLKFLKELFSEVCTIFPGKYLHLGGDEAPKKNWEKCPHCQQRIKQNSLKSEDALQSWLIRQLTNHVKALGKTIIGWDEILDGGIDQEPIVMVWRGDGKDAASFASVSGNRYILTPNHFTYFDWRQSELPGEQGAFGVTTLEKVYSLNPHTYTFADPSLLIGVQANVWTEHMHNPTEVEYMVFPRIYALAEIAWTDPTQLNWEDFQQRLDFWETQR